MGGPGAPARDADGRAVPDAGGVRWQHTWHHRTARRGGVPESIRKRKISMEALADKLSLPSSIRTDAHDISAPAGAAAHARHK